MADSNFVDYVKLFLASGDGGGYSGERAKERLCSKFYGNLLP